MLRIRREKERKVRKRKKEVPPRFEYPVEIPATIHLREIGRSVKMTWSEKPRLREMKQCPEIAFMDL